MLKVVAVPALEDQFRFRLNEQFLSKYRGQQPAWGPLGYVTYLRTYSRPMYDASGEITRNEEWVDTLERVTNGTFSYLKRQVLSCGQHWDEAKAQQEAADFFVGMWHFKWLPPGRGLWMMGTEYVERNGSAALQNCFAGKQKFLSRSGPITLAETVGRDLEVWTKAGWKTGSVRRFGRQPTQLVTFRPGCGGKRLGRGNHRVTVEVTADHRWFLHGGTTTTDLTVGDLVLSAKNEDTETSSDTYVAGMRHGIIFGDGTAGYQYVDGVRRNFFARLCGKKIAMAQHFSHVQSRLDNGDVVVDVISDIDLKDFPNASILSDRGHDVATYVRGFMDGWVATDGSSNQASVRLGTQDPRSEAWLRDFAALGGWMLAGHSVDSVMETNFGRRAAPMHVFVLTRDPNRTWEVVSIEPLNNEEDVYCLTVPGEEAFTLSDGIYTSNCGFCATARIEHDFAEPFCEIMDYSMLGVGMGFDVSGAGRVTIQAPTRSGVHVVADTREGWVQVVRLTLNAYVGKNPLPTFDYSLVRPEGSPIRGFGGTASGPAPLQELAAFIVATLDALIGQTLTVTAITDIANCIGRCVVAGNVRRSSEIAISDHTDEEFRSLKDPTQLVRLLQEQQDVARTIPEWVDLEKAKNVAQQAQHGLSVLDPEFLVQQRTIEDLRARQALIVNENPRWLDLDQAIKAHPLRHHRWASNNSVNGDVIQNRRPDYQTIGQQIATNGEPGVIWLQQMRAFGRLADPATHADAKVVGCNPCLTGDTRIATQHGMIPIAELAQKKTKLRVTVDTRIEADYQVGRKTGTYSMPASEAFQTSASEPVFRIETRNGNVIRATSYHKFPTPDGFVELKDLSVGDTLLLQSDEGQWGQDGSEELGVVIGSLEGDGHLTTDIKMSLAEFGYREKGTVPEVIWRGTREIVRGYLRGLFSVGGAINGAGMFSLRYVDFNQELLRGVQALLLNFGIVSSIYKHCDSGDNSGYDLVISKVNAVAYVEKIGFLDTARTAAYAAWRASWRREPYAEDFTDQILSITEDGSEPVFCLTQPETHSFIAAGIVTGNCGEQSLEDGELCCLVETFPTNHGGLHDYLCTLKYAFLYAKVVTCIPTHNARTNAIIARNRRIGTSQADVSLLYEQLGLRECIQWWDTGYKALRRLDEKYSGWMGCPRSVKVTSIKPGGTVPLLAGVEGGMKFVFNRHQFRTIRIDHLSPLVPVLEAAGYRVEPDLTTPRSVVCYFPIQQQRKRYARDISIWEQAELMAALQAYWSDNMVSATLTFRPEEAQDIGRLLEAFEHRLKGISFLPLIDHGYPQAPYIPCTAAEYEAATAKLQPLVFSENAETHESAAEERFCSGDKCEVNFG